MDHRHEREQVLVVDRGDGLMDAGLVGDRVAEQPERTPYQAGEPGLLAAG